MPILKIARLGHPVLRRVAEPIALESIGSPETESLIDSMIETCRDADGAGLAAPQVYVSRRLVLMDLEGTNPRYPGVGSYPMTIAINPVIVPLDGERQFVWEGCLSVPGLRGRVERHRRVRFQALDRAGVPFALELEGFPAAVVQHECDHLDGILYVDRVEPKTLQFLTEFDRFVRPHLDGPIDE